MKDQLQMLLDLQQVDLECDEIRREKDRINGDLDDARTVLRHLREDLSGQKEQLQATVDLQKEKDEERAELEDRYKKSKARINQVTNSKEYSAIELEMENSKRLSEQIEEDLLKLMEAIELTQAAIDEKSAKIDDLTSQIDSEEKVSTKQVAELDVRLEALVADRDALAENIKKEIVRRYSFIRSRRDGVAIVTARDGYCQGCYMQLPPQLYNELQRGTSLHFCPSCQRILFFESEESAVDSASS